MCLPKIRVGTDPNNNSPISSLCTMVTKEKALNFYTKTSYTKQAMNNVLQKGIQKSDTRKYNGLALVVPLHQTG